MYSKSKIEFRCNSQKQVASCLVLAAEHLVLKPIMQGSLKFLPKVYLKVEVCIVISSHRKSSMLMY